MTLGQLKAQIALIDEPDDTPVLLRSRRHDGQYERANCCSPADFDEPLGGGIIDSSGKDPKDPSNLILKRFIGVIIE